MAPRDRSLSICTKSLLRPDVLCRQARVDIAVSANHVAAQLGNVNTKVWPLSQQKVMRVDSGGVGIRG